jgi:transcriptional regulator with XRE-family HTH domain
MDNRRKLLGSRIRDARIRLSYTQEDLAREAALSSSQIVSQIEKGEREVKAWELFNLARALMLEISQLLTTEESELAVPVLWREAPSRDKEIIEAEFLKRCRQYALVERLCSCVFEKQLPAKSGNLNSMGFREAATLGEQVWEELVHSVPCWKTTMGSKYGTRT